MAIEETQACIRSLDKILGEKSIVIVDNASPNDTGKLLSKFYENRNDITVVLNQENSGYACGNNLGCRIAKEIYNPDYFVVINNDVEIPQTDFIERIEKIYEQEDFDILGPDVYLPAEKIHQSPKSLNRTTIVGAQRLLRSYERKKNSKIIVPMKCALRKIGWLIHAVRKKRNKSLGIDYNKKYYDVPLHGSCIIFSKKFIESRKEAFFDKTFFYYELEILDYEAQLNKYKVVYSPELTVIHHHNIATNSVYRNELQKIRFMNEQNYNSIKSFLETYGDNEIMRI